MSNEHLEKAKQLVAGLVQDLGKKGEEAKVDEIVSKALDELKKADPGIRKGRFDTKDATDILKASTDKGEAIQKMLSTPTMDSTVKSFQQANDNVYLLSQMLNKDPRDLKCFKELQEHPIMKTATDAYGGAGAAMPTASTHFGADYIPLGFSAELIDYVRLQLKVAALHRRINMPTPQYKMPVHGGTDITAYLVGETLTVATPEGRPTASRPTSTAITLDAKKIGSLVYFSEEITEDSIVPVVPFLKDSMARSMAFAQENAVINGQKTGTIDTGDAPAASDVRAAWDGYRYKVQAAAKVDCSGWTVGGTYAQGAAYLRSMRAKMGKYGVDPNNLAYVTSISGYHKILGITEVLRLNEYGPNATILSGELGKFDNIPIIVSEYVREDMNAVGVYDGVTTSKTVIMLVHTPSFLFGDRRAITVKTWDMPQDDAHLLVCHQRLDFKSVYDASTNYIVSLGYNLAVS
jgi:HK97 family phage major capsid protein